MTGAAPTIADDRSSSSSSWERPCAALGEQIAAWYRAEFDGIASAQDRATLALNTAQVPDRWRLLIGPHADELDARPDAAILDVGCGYGALALYLAATYPRSRVTAVDVTDRYYRAGRAAAAEAGLANVEFRTQGIGALDGEPRYDVVLLCNMLCYLVSHDELRDGCARAWSVLRPGGLLALHTPQRRAVKEPFTGLHGLAYLPRSWQDRLARASGRRSTMRDVRLPAPGELRRILRGLGAVDVRGVPRDPVRMLLRKHLTMWARKR